MPRPPREPTSALGWFEPSSARALATVFGYAADSVSDATAGMKIWVCPAAYERMLSGKARFRVVLDVTA